MSEAKILNIEFLNDHFKYRREFDEYCVCSSCSEGKCECCGSEIDCDTDLCDCEKVQEKRESFEEFKKEHFQYDDIKGLKVLINTSRTFGILTGRFDIQTISKHFDVKYRELTEFKLTFNNDNICGIIPKGDTKANHYSRDRFEKSRSLLKEPITYYYCLGEALIMQDDNYTVLLAVQID